MFTFRNFLVVVTCALAGMTVNIVSASELVYKPLHPAFGGDPNNFAHFFNLAQTQNQFAGSGADSSSSPPEINFPPITIDLSGVEDAGGTPSPDVSGPTDLTNSQAALPRNTTPLELQ